MTDHILGPLYWERLGKTGRPMFFVHPNPYDRSAWLFQMAHFSTWFQTIAVDLPGFGRSPLATPGLTMAEVAEACWEALDEVSPEAAILVGCSTGSTVVAHMAVQQPDRTLALILPGAGYRPVKNGVLQNLANYESEGLAYRAQHAPVNFSPGFRSSPLAQYFIRLFLERDTTSDIDSAVALLRATSEPDPPDLHARIRAPALIISGTEDNTRLPSFELHKRIAGSEHVSVEGAGHACFMEQPWEVDAHIVDFLKRHGLFP
jgi:pimeloyl-ACP methyl ester carboxylesterase